MIKKSRVNLVGAGPGDPDLLTVKAQRLIGQIDVVVYDKLGSEPILALFPPSVELIFAGKQASKHFMPQAAINDLLVNLFNQGRKVMRLKGGDPFVFGRGGEEALHLAATTWPEDVPQCCHYSESRRKEKLDESIRPQAHSDIIYDEIKTYGLEPDIVIEAKLKEQAIFNYGKTKTICG